jgi:hypothetical protein
MIIFTNFRNERSTDLVRRALFAGIRNLPVRNFTSAGRVIVEFRL